MALLFSHFKHTLPVLAALLALSLCMPKLGLRFFRACERLLDGLARRDALSMILCGLLGFTTALLTSLIFGIPVPGVHDEFSYLLAADTFAHARLTNPTPPLWTHFETFHVLLKPTYMSKYPPAQGLTLALGQALVGLPIVGIWLANGLACAGLWWMLRAWMPPRWALLGGLLSTIHPLILSWSYSYWGGTLAMLGGCLALGAFQRIVEKSEANAGWWMGIGIGIMAVSRPYEGTVLTILLVVGLLRFAGSRHGLKTMLRRGLVQAAIAVTVSLLAIGYYNRSVTGQALKLPYLVYQKAYEPIPLFLVEPMQPIPVYRHEVMRRFYLDVCMSIYRRERTLKGFLAASGDKLSDLISAYSQSLISLVALAGVPMAARRDRRVKFAVVILGLFMLFMLDSVWLTARYVAPVTGLIFLVALQGLRQLRGWRWRNRTTGLTFARITLVTWVVLALSGFIVQMRASAAGQDSKLWAHQRAKIVAQLLHDGQQHLIIVRYARAHNLYREWVYNGADIDHAPVVWARDMGTADNQELIRYFQHRHIWLLDADALPPRLTPYPNGTARKQP